MSGLGIPEQATFDGLLVDGAAVVLVGCALWAAAVLVSAAVEVITAGGLAPARHLGCPPALRRRLVRLVAAVLTALALPWASATAHASNRPEPRPESLAGLALRLEGLPQPDRPVDGPPPRPVEAPAERAATVLVNAGDTLWAIAARHLPAPASAAQVHAYVQALHAANRDLVGSDPDLIHPGQRLLLPRPAPPTTKGSR